MTDTIEQRIVAALETELRADGYDASYYAGIHEAISIVRRECRVTEEMVKRAEKVYAQHYEGRPMKAALEAVIGNNNKGE